MNTTRAQIFREPNSPTHAHSPALSRAGAAYTHTGQKLAAHYQHTAKQALTEVIHGGQAAATNPRTISSVKEAMDAARYNAAQARVQRKVYDAVLDVTTPQAGESLLDWGANTGALGFSTIERREDSFTYIPVDGSSEAIDQIDANLSPLFTGEVLPLVHTDPLELKPGSVDHVVALGSITHWALDVPDVQAKVEALIEHFASVARKTAVISLYPTRQFNNIALTWGALTMLSAYTEISNGPAIEPLSSIMLGTSLAAMLLANPASRRALFNHMPAPLASTGRAIASRFTDHFDPIGNWIHEIDTPALVASLRRKGYDVELISVDKSVKANKSKIPHGPWDLIVIRKTQNIP
jgi:precorrin-6B methylase 2